MYGYMHTYTCVGYLARICSTIKGSSSAMIPWYVHKYDIHMCIYICMYTCVGYLARIRWIVKRSSSAIIPLWYTYEYTWIHIYTNMYIKNVHKCNKYMCVYIYMYTCVGYLARIRSTVKGSSSAMIPLKSSVIVKGTRVAACLLSCSEYICTNTHICILIYIYMYIYICTYLNTNCLGHAHFCLSFVVLWICMYICMYIDICI